VPVHRVARVVALESRLEHGLRSALPVVMLHTGYNSGKSQIIA
jgi:hypothetical protein